MKAFYWLVFGCPVCGRRTRASTALREWKLRPDPAFESAEIMVTQSHGYAKIANLREPLWAALRTAPSKLGEHAGEFFDDLARRLETAARMAREAARRARWG